MLASQPALADGVASTAVYRYRKLPVDSLSAFQRADERADLLSRTEKTIKQVGGTHGDGGR